jgi:hypothetical protein
VEELHDRPAATAPLCSTRAFTVRWTFFRGSWQKSLPPFSERALAKDAGSASIWSQEVEVAGHELGALLGPALAVHEANGVIFRAFARVRRGA